MRRVVWALTLSLVLVALGAGAAAADAVDVRAKQLRRGDYKVRLSAALWLSRSDDPRALSALARALVKDSRSTVRELAVRSLAKQADESVPSAVRKRVIDALERAARRDRRSKVRRLARRTLTQWESLRESPVRTLSEVFVAIDTASDRSRRVSSRDLRALDGTLRTAIRQGAPRYRYGMRADGLPSRAELQRARAAGFYVKATVSDVRARRSGGGVEVACAVEVRVSSWEGADQRLRLRAGEFASATGRGKVVGGSSRTGVARSTRDCVLAVTESVTKRQVLPFLARQARAALSAQVTATTATRSARASRKRTRRRR